MNRLFTSLQHRCRAGPRALRRVRRALREKARSLFSVAKDIVQVRKLRAELEAEQVMAHGLDFQVNYLQHDAAETNAVLERFVQESGQLWRVIDEIVIPTFTKCDGRCGNESCQLKLLIEELPERFNEAEFLAALQAAEPLIHGI